MTYFDRSFRGKNDVTTWAGLVLGVAASGCSAPAEQPRSAETVAEIAEALPTGQQGILRASDPTLVFNPATSAWLSFSGSESVSRTDPRDPAIKACVGTTWSRNFAFVPFRTGPTPSQLAECWQGDAFGSSRPSWVVNAKGSVNSPAIAKFPNDWRLFYTGTKSNGQRCLGVATSTTGPTSGWSHGANALYCPPNAALSATDPEIFFNQPNGRWYLLWREDTSSCNSVINVAEYATSTTIITSQRTLLMASAAALQFDEFNAGSCNPAHRIESPSMVRADNGQLWLFFSANRRGASTAEDPMLGRNYATGWAICGTSSPTEGGPCGLINVFDPTSFYRPHWGASNRTAPVSGLNAKPMMGFPDLTRGFGGLSVAVANPAAAGPQPVYATAQLHGGATTSQTVLRLDRTSSVPALYETETIAWHRAPRQPEEPALFGPFARSGQPIASREIPGFHWLPGMSAVFTDVTSDGTVFAPGVDFEHGLFFPTSPFAALGLHEPATNKWLTLKLKTSGNAETILPQPLGEPETGFLGGAALGDVQVIDGGQAMAFTVPSPIPPGYWPNGTRGPVPPAEGIWPTLGIATKVNGVWTVLRENQWTGRQLRENPDNKPGEGASACPFAEIYPSGESNCRTPNELSELPASKHLVITQYLHGVPGDTGVMVVRYTRQADGKYKIAIIDAYQIPPIDVNLAQPGERIFLLPKEVSVDQSARTTCEDPVDRQQKPCDERFTLAFDMWLRNPATGKYTIPASPHVLQEFKYNSITGKIEPSSPPIIHRIQQSDGTPVGPSNSRYDRDGNLWAFGGQLMMYAKINGIRKISTSACGWDPAKHLNSYRTNVNGVQVWGQLCAPDYEVLQAQQIGSHYRAFTFTEDPRASTTNPLTNTMIGVSAFASQILPIRYSGTGRNMTFTIGNVLDPGMTAVSNASVATRPGVFDRTGRILYNVSAFHRPANTVVPHHMFAVDIEQLFDPPPVVLPSVSSEDWVKVQAENIVPAAVQPPCPSPCVNTMTVDAPGMVMTSDPNEITLAAANELVGDRAGGHGAGQVEYNVWVPSNVPTTGAQYKVQYQVLGHAGARIVLAVDNGSGISTNATVTTRGLIDGPQNLTIGPGRHRIKIELIPAAGAAPPPLRLDWIQFKRL